MLKQHAQVACPHRQQHRRVGQIVDRFTVVETSLMPQRLALSHVQVVRVPNALALELSTHVSPTLLAMTQVHTIAVLPGIMLHPTVCSHVSHQATVRRILIVFPILPATSTKRSCAVQVLRMPLHANVPVRLARQVTATLESPALPIPLVANHLPMMLKLHLQHHQSRIFVAVLLMKPPRIVQFHAQMDRLMYVPRIKPVLLTRLAKTKLLFSAELRGKTPRNPVRNRATATMNATTVKSVLATLHV